jgi:hypothetical protein
VERHVRQEVDETHLAVGDKANDAVRVDAAEVRVRLIGEGGNPGVTLTDAHDRSGRGEPVHRRHVDGWFPGEDGLAVVHGAEHVRLALNSFLVS